MKKDSLIAFSLFSSGGIADLALRACGVSCLVANELLPDRAALYRTNFPESMMIEGDIWKVQDDIIAEATRRSEGRQYDFAFATPPCQGMSTNGMGKLLNSISVDVYQGHRLAFPFALLPFHFRLLNSSNCFGQLAGGFQHVLSSRA
jgi:site-specific DNA-cytosine methylase